MSNITYNRKIMEAKAPRVSRLHMIATQTPRLNAPFVFVIVAAAIAWGGILGAVL